MLNFGPAAMGLCAIYSRSENGGFGEPPEITLTISQLGPVGPALPGGQNLASFNGFGIHSRRSHHVPQYV